MKNEVKFASAEFILEVGREEERALESLSDPWNATQLLQQLQKEAGIGLAKMRQGFASISAPMKHLQSMVLAGKIRHRRDPVTRWMFNNVSLKSDPAGNCKPDKEKSVERMDGIVALIEAIARAALRREVVNPYEGGRLSFVGLCLTAEEIAGTGTAAHTVTW